MPFLLPTFEVQGGNKQNDTYGIPQRQKEIAEIYAEVLTTARFFAI